MMLAYGKKIRHSKISKIYFNSFLDLFPIPSYPTIPIPHCSHHLSVTVSKRLSVSYFMATTTAAVVVAVLLSLALAFATLFFFYFILACVLLKQNLIISFTRKIQLNMYLYKNKMMCMSVFYESARYTA